MTVKVDSKKGCIIMKLIKLAIALVACLALVFAFGSLGAYEAGNLSTLGLIARCEASTAVVWASLYILNREEGERK